MRVLLLLTIFAIASCSKGNEPSTTQKKCWRFTFMQSVGGASCERTQALDTCIDPWVNVNSLEFTDKCGNELGWTAREL
jgi:hypothetical protein